MAALPVASLNYIFRYFNVAAHMLISMCYIVSGDLIWKENAPNHIMFAALADTT